MSKRKTGIRLRGRTITITFSEKDGRALAERLRDGEKLTPELVVEHALGDRPSPEDGAK